MCDHRDRALVDGSLGAGIGPRSIVRGFKDLKRLDITRHQRNCLTSEAKGEEENGRD